MPTLNVQNVLAPASDISDFGRLFLIAQARAMGHFEDGEIECGEALAWELDQFREAVDSLSAEDARLILADAVEWAQYCVGLARRAALQAS